MNRYSETMSWHYLIFIFIKKRILFTALSQILKDIFENFT